MILVISPFGVKRESSSVLTRSVASPTIGYAMVMMTVAMGQTSLLISAPLPRPKIYVRGMYTRYVPVTTIAPPLSAALISHPWREEAHVYQVLVNATR